MATFSENNPTDFVGQALTAGEIESYILELIIELSTLAGAWQLPELERELIVLFTKFNHLGRSIS